MSDDDNMHLNDEERAEAKRLGLTQRQYVEREILKRARYLNRAGGVPRDSFDEAVLRGMIRRAHELMN